MLIFKNWRVYFSSVLGYVRFHQPHDNKKLWFTITCWTNWKQGASNRVASCYLELLDKLQKRIRKTVDSSLATSLECLADSVNVASLSLFCRYYFSRCSSYWLNWSHIVFFEGGLLVILIDCMIFLSPFLDVASMPMSTISFLAQLDSGILCL